MRSIQLALGCIVGVCLLSGAGCPGDGGAPCGGLMGADCPDGQFCDFPDGTCGAADQTGVCRTRPETCTLIFAPVCGCDDQTYGNACEAATAGVSVASDGECNTNGIDVAVCGGLTGEPCAEGEFCNFTDGSCGAADQTGICEVLPEACPEIFAPVCGCDDQTYGNECEANAQGVSVNHEGDCDTNGIVVAECGGIAGETCNEGEFCRFDGGTCGSGDQTGVCEVLPEFCTAIFDPVCGCDGNTYGNECEANREGVSVDHEGSCDGDDCGGLLGLPCVEGQFCNFEDGSCGAADQTGICTTPPDACDDLFDPVCGCDGNTYGNACEAAAAEVSVASEGECP